MYKHKYALIISMFWVAILIVVIVIHNQNLASSEVKKTSINDIDGSMCAKFEYANSGDDPLYVWDPLLPLSTMALTLKEDDEIDYSSLDEDWIYKITFWCHEVTPENQEIVFLIYNDFMLVNETCYTPDSKEVPFSDFVEFFKNKYDYYNENYVNKLNNPFTRREPD